jgi:hypothetical protein
MALDSMSQSLELRPEQLTKLELKPEVLEQEPEHELDRLPAFGGLRVVQRWLK